MNRKPLAFFISGNTPSSKNNKRWTGKFLINSKITMAWKAATKEEWIAQAERFKEILSTVIGPPYYIELTFVRVSKRRFDYINMAQAVLDSMVLYGWLLDDDTTNVKPYFGDAQYNKNAPGVYIKILKQKPKHYDTQN